MNDLETRAGIPAAAPVQELGAPCADHEPTTEKRNAADFLFPGEAEYADRGYPDGQLAMLSVKTSCKDRWRQVVAEADRIKHKHLLTLKPAISTFQTVAMQGQGVQLVL